jgi:photosystem II stability/assembly factor-like uncharacterized protein
VKTVAGCAALVCALFVLRIGSAAAGMLYGLVSTGELYASANGGLTWSVRATLPISDGVALAMGTTTLHLYLARASGAIYRSTDAGLSWTAAGAVPASDLVDFGLRSNGTMFALTATGAVLRSTDDGQTFAAVGTLTGSDFISLAVTPTGALYALSRTGRVAQSGNGGASWTTKVALSVSDAVRIRRGSTNSILFVLTETGAVSRSTDAGTTWVTVGTLSHSYMRGLVWDATQLVAASREGDVARSLDGASWSWQGSINQLFLTALETDALAAEAGGKVLSQASAEIAARPNPLFADDTPEFRLEVQRAAAATVEIYDLQGRKVAAREPEHFSPGSHLIKWSPNLGSPGVYLVRLRTPSGASGWSRWVVLR